ncbi:DUF2793 domain-containing protein [Pseudaestuariivita atlantica]|uniref:C1q domain-containing protein n=1 Tax=Pseudaestuariivita atlantica TaxID=1317121 RepID=A0A0L1JKG8_9RHOB|nr:DUF2793 domain-containing protein [Pseudaestuariivita atlantica]KNG92245.1 hypothetical protein ATO11_18485 [Pseudaestuariivita atlantica]
MSEPTPTLSLPLLAPAQAQKHVTHNEAIQALDTLVQLSVLADDLADPPTAPAAGDSYILPTAPTGAWAGHAGEVTTFNGEAWLFYVPVAGWIAYVADSQSSGTGAVFVHDGTAWGGLPLGALQAITRLGLNTTADAANPFAARLNNALWTALEAGQGGTGALTQTLNRETGGSDLGLVLQENYVTQAILGMFGSDPFRLSLSTDGTNFNDALIADRATGRVTLPNLPRFKGITNFDNFAPVATWVRIAINQMESNDQGVFDAVTSLFTAPEDGTYAFHATLLFKQDTTETVRMRGRFLVNDTTVITGSYGENTGPHKSEETTLDVHGMAALTAGDTVEFQGYMRANQGYFAADGTAFWGWKIG